MSTFVFEGGPETDDASSVVAFGLTFPAGEPVQVDDAHAAAKLRGNQFFREVADEPVKRGPGRPRKED